MTDSAIYIQSNSSKSWQLLLTELDKLEAKIIINKGAKGALVSGIVGAVIMGTVIAGMPDLNDSEDSGFMGGATIGGMLGALMGGLTGSHVEVQKWVNITLKEKSKPEEIKKRLKSIHARHSVGFR